LEIKCTRKGTGGSNPFPSASFVNQESCVTHRELSYDEEIALVRELIAKGDRKHALHHVTSALGLAPERSEWRGPLLDLLGERALLDDLAGQPYFGAQAARAFHLHQRGDLLEAIAIAGDVHAAVPHLGFHQWLVPWVEEAEAKELTVDALVLLRVLVLGYSFGVGRMRLLPAEQAAAEELLPLARLAMKMTDDARVALLASAIMRRAARYDDALAAAERAKPTATREQYLVCRALALRGKRDFDGALEAFEEARRESGDVVHVAEKVRVLADAGRWAEALGEHTGLAAQREPDAENLAEYEAITQAARSKAPPPDAPPLDVVRRRILGHGSFVPMLDATANALSQIGADDGLRAKGPAGAGAAIREGSVRMTVSGVEGPSNRLCMALMLAGAADPRLADYGAPEGELRTVTRRPDPFTLWAREGDVFVQALAPPPEHVSAWVESLAVRELDGTIAEAAFASAPDFLDLWSMAAAAPPPDARARDWVAAIVHPRMPVIRVSEGPAWVHRWQICAVLGLALSEQGWARTEKREALLALLAGVVDWPLAAAIRVAAELALRDTDTTRELRQALIDICPVVAHETNAGIAFALLGALEMLPYVPKEYPAKVRAQLQTDGHLGGSPREAEPPSPPPQAPAKRPWWKLW
jgi:tetratricopeptide (TPR) repeat protein